MSGPLLAVVLAAAIRDVSIAVAEDAEPAVSAGPPLSTAMDEARLDTLIRRLDTRAEGGQGHWQLSVDGRTVTVLADADADRMRIIVPVVRSAELERDLLYRVLQANFDSALDARYSIARGLLWSAFIHPLGSLTDAGFVSGVGQVVNLAATFGSSFSSGALIFEGGDSQDLQRRELIDQLMEKGQVI
ncbi:MAG: hypothetical protein JSW10_04160 [Pseudomonadota bacterium]|nr:MAG: hypothetical protein JSW10_04160 [Pseudomonadota bacterium]